jgi:hypothetical protein
MMRTGFGPQDTESVFQMKQSAKKDQLRETQNEQVLQIHVSLALTILQQKL